MKKATLLLAIILLSFLTIGCKSKKKLVDREKTEVIVKEETKVVEVIEKDVKKDSTVNKSSNTIVITEKKDIELTQGDPNKIIEVIDHTGKKTSYKGANVVIRDVKVQEQTKDTTSIAVTEVEKSKIDKSEETKTNNKTTTKTRKTFSDVTGISPMFGLGMGIAVIVGGVLLYYNWPWLIALFRRKKKG
jgi:hypothetical protein